MKKQILDLHACDASIHMYMKYFFFESNQYILLLFPVATASPFFSCPFSHYLSLLCDFTIFACVLLFSDF